MTLNRLVAALTFALALSIALPVVANDLGNSSWSESDSSNNSASPNGWASGTMLPSQVEPTARAMMGAIKRFYDQHNAIITSTGTSTAYVLTYSVAPSSLFTGQCFTWNPHTTNTGDATLTINGLSAGHIQRAGTNLTGSEFGTGGVAPVTTCFDGTNSQLLAEGHLRANGLAGGDLSGLYPNPTVAKINGSTPAAVATSGSASDLTAGTLPNARLAISTAQLSDYTAPTTWTPTDASGAALSLTVTDARYVKIGKVAVVSAAITYPSTADGSTAKIGGLPLTSFSGTNPVGGGAAAAVTGIANQVFIAVLNNSTQFTMQGTGGANYTNANLSGVTIRFTIMYITA